MVKNLIPRKVGACRRLNVKFNHVTWIMHDPLHNPQPEIVYQLIGNWYLSVINHVSIVSRLKVSSCVNSKQSTQTLGRLQTASVVITVGSLGNQNTFIRPYIRSFFTSLGCLLYLLQ